ncbi:nnp-1 protein putative nuclear protein 1 nop52 [Anaeramoeba flamelloides]|uniref:Nnp-1 protein putative nuclear protein 1 nop52 n=1 Tax=Anaeramoeba flamelloides TaxID=1746091 RepID=A0ABQ8YKJ9_9EUKA|nr:nnp-1 protein putative nuclear protein 1 nop52 [Anaeramoeba flamelloides]
MTFPKNLKNWEKGTSFSSQRKQKKFFQKYSKDLLVQFEKLGTKSVSKEIGDVSDLSLNLFWYLDKKQVIYLRKHESRRQKGKKSSYKTKEEFLARYLHKDLSLNILLCLKHLTLENTYREISEEEKGNGNGNDNDNDHDNHNGNSLYIKGFATYMIDHLFAITSELVRDKAHTASEQIVPLLRMVLQRKMIFHKKHEKKQVPLAIHIVQILESLCENEEAVKEIGNERNITKLITVTGIKEFDSVLTFFVMRRILMKVGRQAIRFKNTNFFQTNPQFLKHIISMIGPNGGWPFLWLLELLTDLIELIGQTIKMEKSERILRIFEKNNGYNKLTEIAHQLLEKGGGQEVCSFLRLLKDFVIIGVPIPNTKTATFQDQNSDKKKFKKSISDLELETRKTRKKEKNGDDQISTSGSVIEKGKKQQKDKKIKIDTNSDNINTEINTSDSSEKESEIENDEKTEQQPDSETEKQNSDDNSTSIQGNSGNSKTETESETNSEKEFKNEKESESNSEDVPTHEKEKTKKKIEIEKNYKKNKNENQLELESEDGYHQDTLNKRNEGESEDNGIQKNKVFLKPNEKVYDIILEISLSKKGKEICNETLISIIIEILNTYTKYWRIVNKEEPIRQMFKLFFKLKPTVKQSLLIAFQNLVEAIFEELSNKKKKKKKKKKKNNNNNNDGDNHNNSDGGSDHKLNQRTVKQLQNDQEILEMVKTFLGFIDNKNSQEGTNLILFTHINSIIQSRTEWGSFLRKAGILPIIISHLKLRTSGRENEQIVLCLLEFLSYFLPISELNRKGFFQLGGYQEIKHCLLSDQLRWSSLNILTQIVKVVEEKESFQIIQDLILLLNNTGNGNLLSMNVFTIRNDVLTALSTMALLNSKIKNHFFANGGFTWIFKILKSLSSTIYQLTKSIEKENEKKKTRKKLTLKDIYNRFNFSQPNQKNNNEQLSQTNGIDHSEINLYGTYLFIDTLLRTVSTMINNNTDNKKMIDQIFLDLNNSLFIPLMKLQLFKSKYIALLFHSLINLSTGGNWTQYPKYGIDYQFPNYSKLNQHLLNFPLNLILPTLDNKKNQDNDKLVLDHDKNFFFLNELLQNPITNLEIFTLYSQKEIYFNNITKNKNSNQLQTNPILIQYPQIINLILKIILYLFNSRLNKMGFLKILLNEFKEIFLDQKHELYHIFFQLFETISLTMVTPQSLKLYFSLMNKQKYPINLLISLVKMCRKKFVPNNYIEFNYNNNSSSSDNKNNNVKQQTGELKFEKIINQSLFNIKGYSLSIWFNIRSFGNLTKNAKINIINLYLNENNNMQFSINIYGNINIELKLKQKQTINLNFTNKKIISNQWYHLLFTQNASSKNKKQGSPLFFYLNGIFIEKKEIYYPLFNKNKKSSLKFGGWIKKQNNKNVSWQFTNPTIFTRQLTNEQIFILYTLGFNYDYYLFHKTLSTFLLHEEIINNPKYINFFEEHLNLIVNWKKQPTEFLKKKILFSFIIRKSLIKIKLSKNEIQENNSKSSTDRLTIINKYYNQKFVNPNNCYYNYYKNHFFKQSLQSIGGVNCLLTFLAQTLFRKNNEYQFNSLHLIKHYMINQPPKLLMKEKTIFHLLSFLFINKNWKMTTKMFKLIFNFSGAKIIKYYKNKPEKFELEGFFTNMPALFELILNWEIWENQPMEYQINIFNIIIILISKNYTFHKINISQLQKSQFLLKIFNLIKEHPAINYKITQKILKIFNAIDQTTNGLLNILNLLIETQYLDFNQKEKKESSIIKKHRNKYKKNNKILNFTNSINNDPIQQNRILFINYLSDTIKNNQNAPFVSDFILKCDSENLVSILRHPSVSIRTSVLKLIRSFLFSSKFLYRFQEKHGFNFIGHFLSYFEINNEILDFLFLITKICYQIIPIKILISNSTLFAFKTQVLDRLLNLFKNSNLVEKFKYIQNGLIDLLCEIILSETKEVKKLKNNKELLKDIKTNLLEKGKGKKSRGKGKKAKKIKEKEEKKSSGKAKLSIINEAKLFLRNIGRFSINFDQGIGRVFRQIIRLVSKLETELGSEIIRSIQQSIFLTIFKIIEKKITNLKDKVEQDRIFRDNVRDFTKFAYRMTIYWIVYSQKSNKKNIRNNFPTNNDLFFIDQIFKFFIKLQEIEIFVFLKDLLCKTIILILFNKLNNYSIQILCLKLLKNNHELFDYILQKDRFDSLLKYSLCSIVLYNKEQRQKIKKKNNENGKKLEKETEKEKQKGIEKGKGKGKEKEKENENENKKENGSKKEKGNKKEKEKEKKTSEEKKINKEVEFNNLAEGLLKDIFKRMKKKFLEKIFKKDFYKQARKTLQQNKKKYINWEKKTIEKYLKFIRFLTNNPRIYRRESNTDFLPPPPNLDQVQINFILNKFNNQIETQKKIENRKLLNKLRNDYQTTKLWGTIIKQMTNERAVLFQKPYLTLFLKDSTEGPMRVRKRLKKIFIYNEDEINKYLKKFNFINQKNNQKVLKKFKNQLIKENKIFKKISLDNYLNIIKFKKQKKKNKNKKDNDIINNKEIIKTLCHRDFDYYKIIKDINPKIKTNKFNIQICNNTQSFDNSNCQGEIIFGKKSFHLLLNNTNNNSHKKKIYKQFDYILIRELYPQRYFLKDIALEIIFANGKTLFLIYNNKSQRDETFKILKSQDLQNISQLLGKHFDKFLPLRKCIQLWKTRKISNFQYLMWLNTLASRTFNDLNQYPIFPYLISNYNSPELDDTNIDNFRDLRVLMGCLNRFRKERYLENYENIKSKNFKNMKQKEKGKGKEKENENKNENEKETERETGNVKEQEKKIMPYHYSNFSSNFQTVLFYLMRIEPFYSKLSGMKKQLNNEDLFISIKNSYKQSSSLLLNDIKELIPEYFYFPEMFININGFNFGHQNKNFNNDIDLPTWANNDIRLFIKKQREILESEKVSQTLNYWIDHIFGYKLFGEKAKDSINVYHPICYQQEKDKEREKENEKENKNEREKEKEEEKKRKGRRKRKRRRKRKAKGKEKGKGKRK